MENQFFEKPILNLPYEYPARHRELDADGQPTQLVKEERRRAEFITPIPKPKKRVADSKQSLMVLSDDDGISTKQQQYHATIINEVRLHVNQWRNLPASVWQVTPETARLLQHWRHHDFSDMERAPKHRGK